MTHNMNILLFVRLEVRRSKKTFGAARLLKIEFELKTKILKTFINRWTHVVSCEEFTNEISFESFDWAISSKFHACHDIVAFKY